MRGVRLNGGRYSVYSFVLLVQVLLSVVRGGFRGVRYSGVLNVGFSVGTWTIVRY